MIFHPLHRRLAAVLLVLLLGLGGLLVASIPTTTRLHHQETLQASHHDLAHNIVAMKTDQLLVDGRPAGQGLDALFHWLMVVNPGLEVYLLDAEGEILAFDAPPGTVVRERVDLEPISRFLADGDLPLVGDDPRSTDGRKVFSVAPLSFEGETVGYLYAILEGQKVEAATATFWEGHILRLSLLTGVGVLLLTALGGALLLRSLTRPLRRLHHRMATLANSGTGRSDSTTPMAGDEVEALERTFEAMVARLAGQVEQIETLAAQRHELVANVSHDLRTPLASLQGYLETLSLKGTSLDALERATFVDLALRQSRRLAKLIDELFEIAKLDSHLVEPQPEPFSLPELVQDNIQRFQHEAEHRGVRLEAPIAPGLPAVLADIGWVERVLENLIENALRFTPAGGTVAVELAPRDDQRLAVAVRDTGCGISEEDLPRVFDRAYRCQMKGSPQGEGTGLGLSIAQRIVELHGDSISVESTLGQGTTFRFSLPLAPALASAS